MTPARPPFGPLQTVSILYYALQCQTPHTCVHVPHKSTATEFREPPRPRGFLSSTSTSAIVGRPKLLEPKQRRGRVAPPLCSKITPVSMLCRVAAGARPNPRI